MYAPSNETRAHSLFIYLCWIYSVRIDLCFGILFLQFHSLPIVAIAAANAFEFKELWAIRPPALRRYRRRTHNIFLRTLKMQFWQLSVGKLHRRNSNRMQNARGHSNYFYRLFLPSQMATKRMKIKKKNQVISNEERIIYRKFRTAAMVGRCDVLMINAPNNK